MIIPVIYTIINFFSVKYIVDKIFHNNRTKTVLLYSPFIFYMVYTVCVLVLPKIYLLELLLAVFCILIQIFSVFCVSKSYTISFWSSLRTYIFITLIEAILSGLLANLFQFTENETYALELIVSLLIFVSIVVISHMKISDRVENTILWLSPGIKNFLLIVLATCSLCLSLIFKKEYYYEYFDRWILFISVLVAFFTIVTAIAFPVIIASSSANTYLKRLNEQYIKQIDGQMSHYKATSQYNYEIRKFRHDYKNTNIALLDLLKNNNTTAAVELLQQSNENIQNLTFDLVPYDTGNDIADSLLKEKQLYIKNENIDIKFSGVIPKSSVSSHDICIILGNALDNAIEACQKGSKDIPKSILVESVCRNGFMFLKVQNPVYEKVYIKNNTISTTKSNKGMHGFGISSIRKAAETYKGVVKLSCIDGIFILEIELELTK